MTDLTPTDPGTTTTAVDGQQANIAVGCHLLGFLGLLVPFGHILGPLALWLIKRQGNPFVDEQGREAVNFQISFSLWGILGGIIALVLVWTVVIPILIGIAMLVLVLIWVVTMILGAVRASRGQSHRYPFTLRLIR